MESDRWASIERLYHAALEREPAARAAFLDEACAGDEMLRRQVAALLACDGQSPGFIESPAVEVAARALAANLSLSEEAETLAIKLPPQIGAYQVLSPLGRGGMGEVHLALDTRLRRKVAIKLLPAEFTADTGRVRRFEQEARAASALNHPNIITVYEIGALPMEAGNRRYIVTEYVEGETLRQRMKNAPQQRINLSEAIDVASQIAAALSAAHEAGIAHRDIKPENVMVRRDGIVKVLDFGLAKLTEPSAPALDSPRGGSPEVDSKDSTLIKNSTASGVVMGTPRYMSPEQARGEKVDARTDIFSLGVTLYEMITGRTPFMSETPGEMIAAILRDEPPPLAEAPPELQRMVGKALRKNREDRYQGIKDLLTDLKSLKQDLELEERERTGRTGKGHAASGAGRLISGIKRHKLGTLLALAVVAGIAFGLYRWFIQFRPSLPLRAPKIERLTNNGKAVRAAISPDGKLVAYAMWEAGKQSLWLKQTTIAGAGNNVRPPADLYYLWLSFSHDGDSLYYLTQDDASRACALYRIPVLGSAPPRKVIANIMSTVALSPDGQRLAFMRAYQTQLEFTLMLANVDGSGEQKLVTRKHPDGFSNRTGLAWSPDGKVISCSAFSNADGLREIVIAVNVTDGRQWQISSRKWFGVYDMAWLADGSGLIMRARDQAKGLQSQLWRLSYPDGEARKLTNDLDNYEGVSLAANSNTLVTVKVDYSLGILVAPYGKAGPPKQVTSRTNMDEGSSGIAWTPDDKILYASTENGNFDIWTIDADGGAKQPLTADAGQNFYPTASPDGRYVVFNSDRGGVSDIWRMDIDGGNLKRLTRSHDAWYPQYSRDGRSVVYLNGSSGQTVWKAPIDGAAPLQLTSNDREAVRLAISRNGKWLAYATFNEQNRGVIKIIPFEGGPIIKTIALPLTISPEANFVWTPDDRAVIYVSNIGGVSNVWKQPLDGKAPTQMTDFKSSLIWWLDLSRDGKQLAMSRGEANSDVVLISNFR
jgi:eukaryotic-like serine/threonine-protein kinase